MEVSDMDWGAFGTAMVQGTIAVLWFTVVGIAVRGFIIGALGDSKQGE